MITEVEILKRLDHPHIINVLQYYVSYNSIYIVTDFCGGGELFDFIIE